MEATLASPGPPFSFFLFLPFLGLSKDPSLPSALCLSYLSYYLPSYLPGAHPFFLTSTCFFLNSGSTAHDPGSSHPGHPLAWGWETNGQAVFRVLCYAYFVFSLFGPPVLPPLICTFLELRVWLSRRRLPAQAVAVSGQSGRRAWGWGAPF